MFYRDDQETIISSVDQHGDAVMTYVSQAHKQETFRFLNSRVVNAKQDQDIVLQYKNDHVHVIAEAVNRAPMYCNFLTSRGYKNILFVGHFDVADYKWFHERQVDDPASRMHDMFPPERQGNLFYPNIDIIVQFIPIFLNLWNYEPKVTIVRPPEPKHKGLMHHLYNKFRVTDNMVQSNKQYKHVVDGYELDIPEGTAKFDAVVFAGVPNQEGETAFQLQQIQDIFAPYLTSNAHYVDIYQNQGTSRSFRFFRDNVRTEKDIAGNLGAVMTARSIWDKETRNQGRGHEYAFLKRQIRVFTP
mgnify:CR=1